MLAFDSTFCKALPQLSHHSSSSRFPDQLPVSSDTKKSWGGFVMASRHLFFFPFTVCQVVYWLPVFWLAALRANLTAGLWIVLTDESVCFKKFFFLFPQPERQTSWWKEPAASLRGHARAKRQRLCRLYYRNWNSKAVVFPSGLFLFFLFIRPLHHSLRTSPLHPSILSLVPSRPHSLLASHSSSPLTIFCLNNSFCASFPFLELCPPSSSSLSPPPFLSFIAPMPSFPSQCLLFPFCHSSSVLFVIFVCCPHSLPSFPLVFSISPSFLTEPLILLSSVISLPYFPPSFLSFLFPLSF